MVLISSHFLLPFFITLAYAFKDFKYTIGNGPPQFDPFWQNEIQPGDRLTFHFYNRSGKHSVGSGPIEKPCTLFDSNADPEYTTSFYSAETEADATGANLFQVTVNNTSPIYMFSSAGRDCQNQLLGIINVDHGTAAAAAAASWANAAKAVPTSAPLPQKEYGGAWFTAIVQIQSNDIESTNVAASGTRVSTSTTVLLSTFTPTASAGIVPAIATASVGVTMTGQSAMSDPEPAPTSAVTTATKKSCASIPLILLWHLLACIIGGILVL